MKLKCLIVVRCGESETIHNQLTNFGRMQMLALNEMLKPYFDRLGSSSVLIVTPPSIPERESAWIIANAFDFDVEENDALCIDTDHPKDSLGSAFDFVESKSEEVEVLIVITQKDYASRLMCYYSGRKIGYSFGNFLTNNGDAIVYEDRGFTMTHIQNPHKSR